MASEAPELRIRELAQAVLERDVEATELSALAHGALDAGTLERLRDTAPGDPGLNASLEAFAPLSESEQEAISLRLLAELDTPRHSLVAPASSRRSPAGCDAARPALRRHGLGRRVVMVLPLLAAVAALCVLVVQTRVDTIARYQLELTPTRAERRAAGSASTIRPAPGEHVQLVLRPNVAVSGRVAALAIWLSGEASLTPLEAVVGTSDAGVLRLDSSIPRDLPPGRLVILVGRPDRLSAELVFRKESAGRGWQRIDPFATTADAN